MASTAPTTGKAAAGSDRATRDTTRKNRRFFLGILAACVAVIAFAAAVGIYKLAYDTRDAIPEPDVDLSTLFSTGTFKALPDVRNPAIVLQEHLEHLRSRRYEAAYRDQSKNLGALAPLEEFTDNVRKNEPLFREVAAYSFPAYTADGDSAAVSGTISYEDGNKSRVDATLVRESGKWKVAGITLIYQ